MQYGRDIDQNVKKRTFQSLCESHCIVPSLYRSVLTVSFHAHNIIRMYDILRYARNRRSGWLYTAVGSSPRGCRIPIIGVLEHCRRWQLALDILPAASRSCQKSLCAESVYCS